MAVTRTQSAEDKKRVEEFLRTAMKKQEKGQALTDTEETFLEILEESNDEIMWRDIEFFKHMVE